MNKHYLNIVYNGNINSYENNLDNTYYTNREGDRISSELADLQLSLKEDYLFSSSSVINEKRAEEVILKQMRKWHFLEKPE